MNWTRNFVAGLVLCLAGVGSALADPHHHGHHHGGSHAYFGFTFGPYWGPPYYPLYQVYPPIIVRQAPTIYIEQPPAIAEPPPPPTAYWYYCTAAKAYYPYVKECPSGWQKVPPLPAGEP